ncbi:MAG: hypothetical protein Q8L34_02120, partial [Candidatus Woesearchaeota archaeon]|nr:hypothetical protein [Candidatus Woesearchaeota archaeon]
NSKNLPVCSSVYVTNSNRDGRKIPDKLFKQRIKEVETMLLKLFGGHSTDQLEHGEYLSKNNKLVSEKVARVTVFSNVHVYKKHQNALKKWLLQKKNAWNQETIGYEFESDLYYI